jgi:GH15 family glucan-1,4-alpha-glucosidase
MIDDDESQDEEAITRRSVIKRAALGAAAFGAARTVQDRDVPNWKPNLPRIGDIELRNLKAPSNLADRLSGPGVRDVRYRPWFSLDKFVKGVLQGTEQNNDFQGHNPTEAFLGTPEGRITATITEKGRMNHIFHDDNNFTPYYTNDDEGQLMGSVPEEGSHLELEVNGNTVQPWNAGEAEISAKNNSGIFETEYQAEGVSVEEETYMLPGEGEIRRDYSIKNNSVDEEVQVEAIYSSRLSVNPNEQNFIIPDSNENKAFKSGNGVLVEDTQSGNQLSVSMEGADGVKVDSLFDEGVIEATVDTLQQALYQNILKDSDAEEEDETGNFLDTEIKKEFSLGPREEEEVSISINTDGDHEFAEDAQQQAEEYWQDFFSELDTPSGMSDTEESTYRDCARILAGLHNPEKDFSPAAPSVQPLYHPMWIRDGAFHAVARAKSGQYDLAKRELAGFMADVQSEDGGFQQCFNPEGEQAGVWERQNDQPSLFTWAVSEVYDETQDEEFLDDVWEKVKKSQEYLMDAENRASNGLLKAAPDYSEDAWDFTRQSLWTQMLAYESLSRTAELADQLGEPSKIYKKEAKKIGENTYQTFFEDPEEAFTEIRGLYPREKRRNFGALESFMAWPGTFAEDYGIEDDLIDILDDEVTFPPGFVPGQMNYAGMMYNQGMDEEADELVGEVLGERYPAGGLPEQIQEDGEDNMAYPLAWSQAAYIMAMEEKHGQHGQEG